MSLELAAQHLASRGRKGDTMLVHMAPQEVAGLQALARAGGGTLTLNPDTGLPEANFLKKLLPTLIGVGLTAATGGAAAPWMIGLGLGGLETVRTGSLEKGLMAGLGAYGGAGLAGGLMGAGNAAVSQAASAANPGFMGPMPGAASGTSALGAGIQSLGTKEGFNTFLGNAATKTAEATGMGGGSGLLKTGLAAAAPALMTPTTTGKPVTSSGPNPYEYDFDPTSQTYTRVAPGSRGRDMLAPITPMMAAGGPIEEMSDRNQMQTMMANGGQMFAAGGISHLGDYSDGGRLLKGPGDGVSDSIPATIANKRPARLADGEFVVPARIVSELGNGSTEAGARKLYAMMDRVQKARGKTTGKNRVAINSKAEQLLPA
jgi:hypothetical protein